METVIAVMNEWTVKFIKHMDMIKRDVLEVIPKSNEIEVKRKSADEKYLLIPTLTALPEIGSENTVIVTLNSKENINKIIENWASLIHENIKIIFLNPYSKTEKKWILKPFFHNRVTEKAALKTGLRTMCETVEEIDEKGFSDFLKA